MRGRVYAGRVDYGLQKLASTPRERDKCPARWFYVALLTIAYMVSRGPAKSSRRDYYDNNDTAGDRH